jgi:hypothetical protein
MVSTRKYDSRLYGNVRRKCREGCPDGAERTTLAKSIDVAKFPHHNYGCANLDETIQAKACERYRACSNGCIRKNYYPYYVPGQGRVLKVNPRLSNCAFVAMDLSYTMCLNSGLPLP